MEKEKGKVINEQEPSISVGKLKSDAVETKRRFLQQSKNSCSAQSGILRIICEARRRARALKLQMMSLSYSKGKCRYTNDEDDCIKKIDFKIEQLNDEIRNIDATIRKKQQKLK